MVAPSLSFADFTGGPTRLLPSQGANIAGAGGTISPLPSLPVQRCLDSVDCRFARETAQQTSAWETKGSYRPIPHTLVVLVVQTVVERRTRDRKVAGSLPAGALSSQLGQLSLSSLPGR